MSAETYNSESVEIEVTIVHATERAVLINDGDNDVWLSLAQVEVDYGRGNAATVTVPEWLAIDKGLV